MSICSKCETPLEEKTAVCECGAILFGEVTNVGGWETETIFHVSDGARKRVVPAVAVALAVALAVLALSWPRLSKSIVAETEEPTSVEESVARTPVKSDLIPTDDLIQPDLDVNAENRSGAFEFTTKNGATRFVQKPNTNLIVRKETVSTSDAAVSTNVNSLDAELLSDPTKTNARSTADPADCKPEATTSLKRPDPQPGVAEVISEKKTSGPGYILGPRGGCFIVTASGGKKYVDRGLCNSSTAAARQ